MSTKFETKILYIALTILGLCGVFVFFGVDAFLSLKASEADCNCDPVFYDYIIDLKQNEILVYREDGREFIVHPDSLEEFIQKDNL